MRLTDANKSVTIHRQTTPIYEPVDLSHRGHLCGAPCARFFCIGFGLRGRLVGFAFRLLLVWCLPIAVVYASLSTYIRRNHHVESKQQI
jgi:hypothetical protein